MASVSLNYGCGTNDGVPVDAGLVDVATDSMAPRDAVDVEVSDGVSEDTDDWRADWRASLYDREALLADLHRIATSRCTCVWYRRSSLADFPWETIETCADETLLLFPWGGYSEQDWQVWEADPDRVLALACLGAHFDEARLCFADTIVASTCPEGLEIDCDVALEAAPSVCGDFEW